MFKTTFHTITVAGLLGLSSSVFAGLIDFETVPGGLPSDQLAISNQYSADHGVTFSLLNADNSFSSPFLEAVGNSDAGEGFTYLDNNVPTADKAAPGFEAELGHYFLRFTQTDQVSSPVPQLIISYAANAYTSQASGQIWDIDAHNINGSGGRAQWLVSAFNSSNVLLDSQLSPLGLLPRDAGTLDGRPWTWSFDLASADISEIRISYTGTQTQGIGVGFDNINTHSAAVVPVPAAIWLFGSGLIGLAGIARRKKA